MALGLPRTGAVLALCSSAALGGCISADDIRSVGDLRAYMEERSGLSCEERSSKDVAGGDFVVCFANLTGMQVRLEYFEDEAVGNRVEELLGFRWGMKRGDRWIVAVAEDSAEGRSILDDTP